eukprot:TRINITY_DN124444_c0_g1_i3.p1 TRINITY_DN124444_c0_g1~~TRINITY_DN124444_c0_g1_i3.p1  ORF type:complete len:124 (-),score=9.26 TRINITY_DN124444_c0_g1_i3:313-684(-)
MTKSKAYSQNYVLGSLSHVSGDLVHQQFRFGFRHFQFHSPPTTLYCLVGLIFHRNVFKKSDMSIFLLRIFFFVVIYHTFVLETLLKYYFKRFRDRQASAWVKRRHCFNSLNRPSRSSIFSVNY